MHLQVKFLRFIQERTFRRVGAGHIGGYRLIAFSNRDVEAEVKAGRFRKTCFTGSTSSGLTSCRSGSARGRYALAALHGQYNAALGKEIKKISEEALKLSLTTTTPAT